MPTAPAIADLGPAKLNATVLPVVSWQLPQQLQETLFRHSGQAFAADALHLVKGEAVVITAPWWNAYQLVGLEGLKLTTLELYAATMGDITHASPAALSHPKWGATDAGGVATAVLRAATVSQDGLLLAEIEIRLLTDLARTDSQAIPTVDTPVYHTLGNVQLGGTLLPGIQSVSVDPGTQMQEIRSDGHQYPVDYKLMRREPRISVATDDPRAVRAQMGAEVERLTDGGGDALVCYFREHNAATGQHKSTGFSITVDSALLRAPGYGASEADAALGGELQAVCLQTADGSHPMTVSANTVAMPE